MSRDSSWIEGVSRGGDVQAWSPIPPLPPLNFVGGALEWRKFDFFFSLSPFKIIVVVWFYLLKGVRFPKLDHQRVPPGMIIHAAARR